MKWGRLTGCHQLKERSYFLGKYQFPVCARCTGIYVGGLLSIVAYQYVKLEFWCLLCLVGVMLGDWMLQYYEICESTNHRRFITGTSCGYGLTTIILFLLNSLSV